MPKRNLNEVLGFISRWGDSKFSDKILSEMLSPAQIRAKAKNPDIDPTEMTNLLKMAQVRKERLSKLSKAVKDPKQFRRFDPTTRRKLFTTKEGQSQRELKGLGILSRVGNDLEKMNNLKLPTFTAKDLSTKGRPATPADVAKMNKYRQSVLDVSARKQTGVEDEIREKRNKEKELKDKIETLRQPTATEKTAGVFANIRNVQSGINSLVGGLATGDMIGGASELTGVAANIKRFGITGAGGRQGALERAIAKYEAKTGKKVSRGFTRIRGMGNLTPNQLLNLLRNNRTP